MFTLNENRILSRIKLIASGGRRASTFNDMVTMNSDKVTAKRRLDTNVTSCAGSSNDETAVHTFHPGSSEDSPNLLLYKKVCKLINTIIPNFNSQITD